MKKITLTESEIRTLKIVLWSNHCLSGCVYPDMINFRKDCAECRLTNDIDSIFKKIDN